MSVQIYVDPINGSDNNAGTAIATAVATVAYAESIAPNGITINILFQSVIGSALNTTLTAPSATTANLTTRGGGGGGDISADTGGGGGGEESAAGAAITAGETLTIAFTAGGVGGNGTSTNGGTATIKRGATKLCEAGGGSSGTNGGGGGNGTVIGGTTRHAGGGGDRGGGGAAGNGGNGGSASGDTGGTAGTDTLSLAGAGGAADVGVGLNYGGGGGVGQNGGKGIIMLSYTYVAPVNADISYEVGTQPGAYFATVLDAANDTGQNKQGWTYHPNTHVSLKIGPGTYDMGTSATICMDTPGPGSTITLTNSTWCAPGVLPVITGRLNLGLDTEQLSLVKLEVCNLVIGSNASGGQLTILGQGISPMTVAENVWKNTVVHDILFTGASMTLGAALGYLTFYGSGNATASAYNLVFNNTNGMAAGRYPIQFETQLAGLFTVTFDQSSVFIPQSPSGAVRLNPAVAGATITLTASNNIIVGTSSGYLSSNWTGNTSQIVVSGSGNRGGAQLPGTTSDSITGMTGVTAFVNATGGNLTPLSNASTVVTATTTTITTDFNGATRPQTKAWTNGLGAASAGPIIFAGAINAGITVTGIVAGATTCSWTAFPGADHYQISIDGGAYSATGVTGTSYSGTGGTLYAVRAYDAANNVLGQGSGTYTPSANSATANIQSLLMMGLV